MAIFITLLIERIDVFISQTLDRTKLIEHSTHNAVATVAIAIAIIKFYNLWIYLHRTISADKSQN